MTRRTITLAALTAVLSATALLVIAINPPSTIAAEAPPKQTTPQQTGPKESASKTTEPKETGKEQTEAKQAGPAKLPKYAAPTTLTEARDRARLLHQTIHGLLQAVHQHYYREDEGLPLPSATFEEVFESLEDNWDVRMHWIAVNGKAMRVGHKPQDQFEEAAVKALTSGKREFSKPDRDRYRFVGAIRLSSQCLKCHVPSRKSLEDRIAGLVISMPLDKKDAQ